MRRKPMSERIFECPDCKTKMIAYKQSNRKTKEGHVKDLWCYKCKDFKKFIQLSQYL